MLLQCFCIIVLFFVLNIFFSFSLVSFFVWIYPSITTYPSQTHLILSKLFLQPLIMFWLILKPHLQSTNLRSLADWWFPIYHMVNYIRRNDSQEKLTKLKFSKQFNESTRFPCLCERLALNVFFKEHWT